MEDEARCADAANEIKVAPVTSIPKSRETVLRLRYMPVVSKEKTVTSSTVLGLSSPSTYNPKLSKPATPSRSPGIAAVRRSDLEVRFRWWGGL